MQTIKIQLLNDLATLPTRGSIYSAGLDLSSTDHGCIAPGESKIIKTGLAIDVGIGNVGLIWPRSKLGAKLNIQVQAGVIDADYRGEVMVSLFNAGEKGFEFQPGDKIAQLLVQACVVQEVVLTQELNKTCRGEAGINCQELRL